MKKLIILTAALSMGGAAIAQQPTPNPRGPLPPGDEITSQGTNPEGQAYTPPGYNQGVNAYPPMTQAPAMNQYPPCTRSSDPDRCVQTYERGVRARPMR